MQATILSIFKYAVYLIVAIYVVFNFKYDIQMLQQNSYRIRRYWRWLKPDISSAWRMIDLALIFLCFSTLLNPVANFLIVAVVAIVKICKIARRKYKKPLVFTARVKRIYITASVLALGLSAAVIFSRFQTETYSHEVISIGVLLLMALFSWAIVIAAVFILTPVEKLINRHYYNDAASILKSMPDLKIIGITGSYGKTSTKHYLTRILSEKYDVLMTPGSYNTTMGVIRTVREYMKPYNQVFVCEMGAKQLGDIKEICDLVHPSMGIVTAVGPMHLESFKSIENVQRTKFELVDALPADGFAVVNNDFEYCENRPVENVAVSRYGLANTDNVDYKAVDVEYTPQGTSFTVVGPDNFRETFFTQLVGECNISNLLAAIAIALKLEVPVDRIKYAIAQIEQVEHRLNVKRTPGGVSIIDDAFNSNPAGSKMAVDVLANFKGGQRVIVTPGMIELGDKQFELNKELGAYIGKNVDVAIIVGAYNRDALLAGIDETDMPKENVYPVDSFAEAQNLLSTLLKSGDTVLYENDLPDTFKYCCPVKHFE